MLVADYNGGKTVAVLAQENSVGRPPFFDEESDGEGAGVFEV
jgi:hypothetical protein